MYLLRVLHGGSSGLPYPHMRSSKQGARPSTWMVIRCTAKVPWHKRSSESTYHCGGQARWWPGSQPRGSQVPASKEAARWWARWIAKRQPGSGQVAAKRRPASKKAAGLWPVKRRPATKEAARWWPLGQEAGSQAVAKQQPAKQWPSRQWQRGASQKVLLVPSAKVLSSRVPTPATWPLH